MSERPKDTGDAGGRFERLMLPHLDAAYNLAHWITRDPDEARDAVQEAYLRAFRFFETFHGEDGRAWLLAIVRNVCFSMHRKRSASNNTEEYDEEIHLPEAAASEFSAPPPADPETALIERSDREQVNRAVEALPVEFREVIVLRELEGLSYKEIAQVAGIPIGTVMSRLARGRALIQAVLLGRSSKGERK